MAINLNDQLLAKLVKTISIGEYLFKQGDMGNTMFIIVSGAVLLFRKTHNAERLVGTAGAGEMLGEKAILRSTPYRRSLTAQAKEETTLLEFDTKDLKIIQARMPDFTNRMLEMLTERLDEANELISILQSTDDIDRFVNYLLFFCHHHSNKTNEGIEIGITTTDIQHAINMDGDLVGTLIDELVAREVLKTKKKGFIIPDENALLDQITQLKQVLAA